MLLTVLLRNIFLHQHMCIRSSKTKGTYSCSSWQLLTLIIQLRLPLTGLLNDIEGAFLQLNIRIHCL
ncbi:hypothetical protein D1872_196830 [compost metagenome]